MEPSRVEIRACAHETWEIYHEVLDDQGAVKDLTSCTARWVLKATPYATTTILSKTASLSNGLFKVSVTATENKDIAAGTYYHEMEVTDAASVVRKTMRGPFVLLPTAIRS